MSSVLGVLIKINRVLVHRRRELESTLDPINATGNHCCEGKEHI